MPSRNTPPCSATLGKIAALQKKAFAGFPGSSDDQEDIKLGIKPAGFLLCTRPDNVAVHAVQVGYVE